MSLFHSVQNEDLRRGCSLAAASVYGACRNRLSQFRGEVSEMARVEEVRAADAYKTLNEDWA
ncbi:hypothetical protein [Halorubrum sp. HHNYT27]|uniref:hypothetical protein n=1 Tax=Halorubrum sp. HHNYT27 TaxID=3402275 RepID=UPI003EB75EF3